MLRYKLELLFKYISKEVTFVTKVLYTIGYSCFKIEEFIKVLKKYSINCVIDVRSNPNSKFHTDYNKDYLEGVLTNNGIYYRNYAKEFGARQEDTKYFTDGYLDFDKFTKSEIFLSGVDKLIKSMEKNYTFVLMCAEKDPATCHRNIMIAKEFKKRGYQVNNIWDNGEIETQDDVEKRLINCYFPDRNQLSLFGEQLTEEEMIEQAYCFRNKEIGFKFDDKKETWDLYE